MPKSSDPSPSAARRKALRDADQNIMFKVIESYPIEKYYAMGDRLLMEFEKALDERRLDDAYIFGIRFASFSIDSLPKHKNFSKNPETKRLAVKNSRQVDRVLKSLESVTARMDAEELARQRAHKEAEELKRKEENEKAMNKKESRKDVKQSALAKLKALQTQLSDRRIKPKGVKESSAREGTEEKHVTTKDRSEDDIMLQQERKRLQEQADRLTRQQREKEAKAALLQQEEKRRREEAEELARKQKEKAAAEEWETVKFLANEYAEGLPEDASETLEPTIAVLPPLMSKEKQTIELLEQTVAKQEARLPLLEKARSVLLHTAKAKMDEGNRKGALNCLARRKRLELNMESVKGAIFNMETQILMLESAASNREVTKAMQAASDAMEALHVDMDEVRDNGDVNQAMEEFAQGMADDIMYDEDELLSDLQGTSETETSYDQGLLSLPTVPGILAALTDWKSSKESKKDKESKPERESDPIMASWY